ncbi:MAG: DUF1848 domain-containing protein [Spirochaetaceae bacterium]|jgi:DNA repair photolyase|nr:DUF1848 domain-containing protein [Spirochaetaceae bacterium]
MSAAVFCKLVREGGAMAVVKTLCGRIISVSRRTDVPAYFSDWFFNRLSEGYVEVVNPFNPRQIRHISLLPDDVEGFVFWTKDPAPMLDRLRLLDDYRYYFLFTLNPYGNDIEANLPPKQTLINTFQTLSNAAGRDRVIWRYDPLLLSDTIDTGFHMKNFEKMTEQLSAYTRKVIFSFVDHYKKTKSTMEALSIRSPQTEEKLILAENFSRIAQGAGLALESCAEDIDLSPYSIARASCIDATLLGRLGGKQIAYSKDKWQREFCRCSSSVDIGAYRSCRTGCVYCYAR